METASAPQGECLGDVGTGSDPTGDDELHLPLHTYLSSSAAAAIRTAGRVGMPVCSMKTSCVAAVPPCIPSTTITSAPAATANLTSWSTRVAPTLTKIGVPPLGGLAQLLDLYPQVVGADPIGMATGRALVDAGRQRCAWRPPGGSLFARATFRHHPAWPLDPPRSQPHRLAGDLTDRTRSAREVPDRRGAKRPLRSSGGHAAVTRRRAGADGGGRPPPALLWRWRTRRAKLIPAMVMGMSSSSGLCPVPGPEGPFGSRSARGNPSRG